MKLHSGSEISIIEETHVTKYFGAMFFNCCVRMSILQRGSISYRVLSIASCNNGSPVTTSVWTELQFTLISLNRAFDLLFRTGSFPSLYDLQSIDDE